MQTPTQAEEHQAGQEALVSLIPDLMRQAWPLLDPHNIKGTLPRFLAAVKAIVAQYGRASSAAALQSYRVQRLTAGVTSPMPSVQVAPSPADSVIEEAVGWATSDLYGTVTPESEQAALDRVSEAASQLVLDQSRQTTIDVVRADKAAKGWVRVTEQGACSFCLMLALRGPTYSRAAFDSSNAKFGDHAVLAELRKDGVDLGGKGDFKVHDNCRCHVEPIFNAYEPSARMREIQRLWSDATKGRSGHDARVAFRQAVEGRKVTGSTKKPGKQAPSGSARTLEHDRAELKVLEGLPPAKSSAAAEYRRKRIDALRKRVGK